IGKSLAAQLLDGRVLKFYEWDSPVSELMSSTKSTLDEMAEGWSEEELQACVGQTRASFEAGGKLLDCLR
ncbi:hypothetical protein TeGR_g13698, partial [Tetraparma gracilis]